jgi:3-methylcrotonyl-CoA carboxylase alpha subunit
MFSKILIANRGEIACRVIGTAGRLGIATVAVYSEADARARHVELADEAWPIGPPPARESYLSIENIIDAARRSGAEAIHPGYGFLSENADFAEACAASGIVFIGPPPAAIRAMGSKAEAKRLMEQSGVPLVPGYHGEAQDMATLRRAAERIGYPVLLKASAGGGGKGMRVVEREDGLAGAIDSARGEALAAFGDDRLLIEKYLTRPRHIEIQVFADTHGHCVFLFERDCSIQRRHQKVVEEAPAPFMDPRRRAAMGEAAVAAARAVGYVSAGTVEFIAEGDGFFFMEMNTRLQVEHPVTEMITGQDLVEWQLRVAAGEPLPCDQDELRIEGHAIEVRVYAEDPARNFLPSIGRLVHLRQPRETDSVRVDTGVRQGDDITPYYDPMIAKLIVHGGDRTEAVRRLRAALGEYEVAGVQSNLALLRAIAAHPDFAAGTFDTGFIERHRAELQEPPDGKAMRSALSAATLTLLAEQHEANAQLAGASEQGSPWAVPDAWRMNGEGYQDVRFRGPDGTVLPVRAWPQGNGAYRLDLPDGSVLASLESSEQGRALRVDGARQHVHVLRNSDAFTVILRGVNHVLRWEDPWVPPSVQASAETRLTAPIPARVARVLVRPGEQVRKGAVLLVLEAMKMELPLTAPMDGMIAALRHQPGDMVEEGAELVVFGEEGKAA